MAHSVRSVSRTSRVVLGRAARRQPFLMTSRHFMSVGATMTQVNNISSCQFREHKMVSGMSSHYNLARRLFSGAPNIPDVFELTPENLAIVVKSPKAIIIDCYADWCEPCKQLGPILQKVVKEFSPNVSLAMLNVDTNDKLAAQLQVKSLPTVIAIKDGRMLSRFEGLQDEQNIRAFVTKAAGGGGAETVDAEPDTNTPEAKLEFAQRRFEETKGSQQMDEVTELFAELLTLPEASKKVRAHANAGIVRCALLIGQTETAKSLNEMMQKDAENDEEIKDALLESWCKIAAAEVSFADDLAEIGTKTTDDLTEECTSNTKDAQAHYHLAVRLYCEGNVKEAFNKACRVITIDRTWKDEAGKALANRMLDAMGDDKDTVAWARKRLTNVLLA